MEGLVSDIFLFIDFVFFAVLYLMTHSLIRNLMSLSWTTSHVFEGMSFFLLTDILLLPKVFDFDLEHRVPR